MLAVDKNGNVHAANFNRDRIRVYSPNNALMASINGPLSYCQGAPISISYTATGFNAGNTFSAQLSNANGSFASPTHLGLITSNTSGTFNTVIPSSIPTGTGYRVRIVGSSPSIIGQDNGVNIAISSTLTTPVINGPSTVCPGQTNINYNVTNNIGSTYIWTIPFGSSANTFSGPSINVNIGTASDAVTVREISAGGCSSQVAVKLISIILPPKNNAIVAGPSSVCPDDQNLVYTVTNPPAIMNYNWSVPAGVTILSGGGTKEITVNWGSTSGPIVVTPYNQCSSFTPTTKPISVSAGYALEGTNVFCGSSFCVPFKTVGPIKSGIAGLDFVVNYDPAKITPTGLATKGIVATSYGAFVLNTSTPGKIFVSVFLNSAPSGTFFSGDGEILCIGFNVNVGLPHGTPISLSTQAIEESTYIGSMLSCKAKPATFYSSGILGGRITYRNINNQPIVYNPSNPGANISTDIYGVDSNCETPSTTISRPNTSGIFSYSPYSGSKLLINRDIKGDVNISLLNCSNVQAVINSSDYIRAAAIANFSGEAPSIFELLSADVNLDGKVTAGDVTLISSRSINANNCEFPQKWNYVWNGVGYVPANNYKESKDWLFLDQATLVSPAFTSGFGRNNVPTVPVCLSIPVGTPTCTLSASSNYYGILLGDVNGNWSTNNGNATRLSGAQEIILDLENTIETGSDRLIPVYYSGTDVFTGMDFSIDYSSDLEMKEVISNNVAASTKWNDIEGTRLMVTASTHDKINVVDPITYIAIKTDKKISASDFNNEQAFVNGEPAKITFKKSSSINNTLLEFASVFPNPSNSETFIFVKDDASIVSAKVFTTNGNMVYENSMIPSHTSFLLPDFESGVYYIQIVGTKGTSTQKLIIY
jgi:hypothetical protein